MPDIICNLNVVFGERRHCCRGYVDTDRWETFDAIKALGFEVEGSRPPRTPNSYIRINVNPTDPRLEQALDILEYDGFHDCGLTVAPIDKQDTVFCVDRRRTYSANELSQAELLRLDPFHCDIDILAELRLAAGKPFHLGDQHIVHANELLQQDPQFGQTDVWGIFLLSDQLKRHLEGANLENLDFLPVLYDEPANAARQLWQFWCHTFMPPSLTPCQDHAGASYVEGVSSSRTWDDDGYVPAELRFHRSAVEAMGPFDIALTQERVGLRMSRREIIISQRFREVLETQQPTGYSLVPVQLV